MLDSPRLQLLSAAHLMVGIFRGGFVVIGSYHSTKFAPKQPLAARSETGQATRKSEEVRLYLICGRGFGRQQEKRKECHQILKLFEGAA